jgi:predicted nucleotide-binding protein
MPSFHGSIDELKALVDATGIAGAWTTHENSEHRFTASTGAILCWWDTKKKSLLYQGPKPAREALEAAINATQEGGAVPLIAKSPAAANDDAATRVFVVHGHDEASREQLERILMILGLDPFVLQNTSGHGMTIIEALEQQIGKAPEAKFGIVLMTPDDMGYSNRDGEAAVQPRARQNVVMEMGMLLSSLTRERVAILVKGHVEQPSDANGIIYLHFNNHVKEVVPRLTERLRAVGFDIAPNQITKAAS